METYTEVFDRDALSYILDNEEYYKTLVTPNDIYPPFEICRKYLAKAIGKRHDHVIVNYGKNAGRGRRFARKGLSLQTMPRQIRGTISHNLYYDIDMVNCHPCVIKAMCKARKTPCIYLSAFIDDRDTVVDEIISLNPCADRDFVKKTILSIIYGGRNMGCIVDETDWLKGFKKEIGLLHGMVPEWFPEEYGYQLSVKGSDYFNLCGSTLSASVCVIEDQLLEIMVNHLKSKKLIDKICVLTFDGIMVLKKKFKNQKSVSATLLEIEEKFREAGYDIKLKIKDFQILPKVPGYAEGRCKDPHPKTDVDYVSELGRGAELGCDSDSDCELPNNWVSSGVSNSECKKLYLNSNYFWFDFMNDMNAYDRGGVHPSYVSLCQVFTDNVNKVMFRVYEMDDCYVRKISVENMFNIDKCSLKEVFRYWDIAEDGSRFVNKISMRRLMITDGLISSVKCYNRLDFRPFGVFESPDRYDDCIENQRCFNTWSNFQAKLLPKDQVDMKLIEPILTHIKRVWCADDETIYKYMLSWFHTIFTKPSFKSKVAMVLKSKEKQIGKGVLISDFLIPYVFGKQYAMSIAGLDTITAKFNELVMNKLFINCDELSTLDGGYHQSFDVLKKRISDGTIKIEIKGGKSFIYPDFCNYIMCTNNDFTIKVEVGDARYLIVECSPIYKGNFKYFNDLANCFNQESANHFLSYISYLDDVVEIRNIPLTKIKRDMMVMGLQSPVRFMLDLKDYMDTDVDDDGEDSFNFCGVDLSKTATRSSALYRCYKEWCAVNNEKVLSCTKFGKEVNDFVVKKRSDGIKIDLRSINVVLN